jgi:formate dehydrogenase beta subunit
VRDGERTAADVIAAMEDSGLRGLGGAGFPAGRKWKIVAAEPAPRLMAINIDEGEPGTFKDRYYLERDPHRFLEGAISSPRGPSASRVYIYLRDEYHGCRAILERELAALQATRPARCPPFHLRRGAGAYICGEESAMIESIEGKRGEPRLRPPYVAQVGPVRPADARAQHGDAPLGARHPREGPRLVRRPRPQRPQGAAIVLGERARQEPGVHLAPAGITLQELVDEYCGGMLDGHTLYGYLPGGASGGILPASMANIPLDFDTLTPYGCFIGSAAIVVCLGPGHGGGGGAQPHAFFADESCGQCTPCRVGTEKALHLMHAPGSGISRCSGAVAGDDGRVDLRPGAGGAQPGALRAEVLPAGGRVMHQNDDP